MWQEKCRSDIWCPPGRAEPTEDSLYHMNFTNKGKAFWAALPTSVYFWIVEEMSGHTRVGWGTPFLGSRSFEAVRYSRPKEQVRWNLEPGPSARASWEGEAFFMWRQTPRSKHTLSSSVTGWTGSVTCKSSLSRSALLKTSLLQACFLEQRQGSLEIHPTEWELSRQSSLDKSGVCGTRAGRKRKKKEKVSGN